MVGCRILAHAIRLQATARPGPSFKSHYCTYICTRTAQLGTPDLGLLIAAFISQHVHVHLQP